MKSLMNDDYNFLKSREEDYIIEAFNLQDGKKFNLLNVLYKREKRLSYKCLAVRRYVKCL